MTANIIRPASHLLRRRPKKTKKKIRKSNTPNMHCIRIERAQNITHDEPQDTAKIAEKGTDNKGSANKHKVLGMTSLRSVSKQPNGCHIEHAHSAHHPSQQ
jgi:hypothetical protein